MSGKRMKALRREFVAKHGRFPRRTIYFTTTPGWQVIVNKKSEVRAIRKAYYRKAA